MPWDRSWGGYLHGCNLKGLNRTDGKQGHVRQMPRGLSISNIALIVIPVRMVADGHELQPPARVEEVVPVHDTLHRETKLASRDQAQPPETINYTEGTKS